MRRNDSLAKICERVLSRPRLSLALGITGLCSSVYIAAVFCAVIVSMVFMGWWTEAIIFTLMGAIPFLAVSLMRELLDLPRPYEVFDGEAFAKLKSERKAGRSFPSRHVFSAFLIGTLVSFISLPIGITVLILSALMAAERVLRGIHFPIDVIVGAIIGIVSGIVGGLFL